MWRMNLSLSSQDYQQMLHWAKSAYPQECCGIIMGHKSPNEQHIIDEARLTENVAQDRLSRFEIDPRALIDAHKACRKNSIEILGYFHSHPNGLAQPSRCDAEMAEMDEKIWLIIAQNNISAWRCHYNGALYGKFTPITLLIDN